MANITTTNNDLGSAALEVWGTVDGVLRNDAVTAQNFAEGTLLARKASDGKLYPYDPAVTPPSDLLSPKYVLPYPVAALATSDNPVTVVSAGKVNSRRLVVHPAIAVTAADLDALLDRPIIPVDLGQLSKVDNPQP